jgi:hypothetical protein
MVSFSAIERRLARMVESYYVRQTYVSFFDGIVVNFNRNHFDVTIEMDNSALYFFFNVL